MERLNGFLHKSRYLFGFLALCAAGALITVYYFNHAVSKLAETHAFPAKILGAVIIACTVLAILSYVTVVWLKIKPLKAYVLFAFIAACLLGIVIPPNAVPDEMTHLKTAYYYSNILMGKSEYNREYTITMRLGDIIDYGHEVNPKIFEDLFGDFSILSKEPHGYLSAKKQVVNSSPFYAYIPQALAVTIARLTNLSGIVTFYLARAFNLIVYFIIFTLALRRMPFAKNALAVIGSVPIALQQAMSLSSDAMIIALSLFAFAEAMYFLYGKKPINLKDVIVMSAAGILLAPCKLVYFAIPLVAFFARRERFENKKIRMAAKIAVPLLTVVSLVAFQFANIAGHVDAESANVNFDTPIYTVSFLFTNTGDFIDILTHTLIGNTPFYYGSMLCSSFGWLQLDTSGVAVAMLTAIIVLSVFVTDRKGDKDGVKILPVERLACIGAMCAVCLLVFLSMFLSWTPNNYKHISGVQGRYLLPALPLIIPILKTKKIAASPRIGNILLFSSNALTFFIIIYIFVQALV